VGKLVRGGREGGFFFSEFNHADIKRTTVHIFRTYFSPPLHFHHPRIFQLFFESKPVLYLSTATVPDANGSLCREVVELIEWNEVLEELIFDHTPEKFHASRGTLHFFFTQ
jgi:hypothetical protein